MDHDAHNQTADKMSQLALLWGKAQHAVSAYIHAAVRNHHDSEDVIQATVSYIAHHFDDYDPTRPFVAWAIGIARYRILEHRNQNQRKPLLLNDDALDALSRVMALESDQTDQRLEALDHCMGRLNPQHRKVLADRYYEHKTREQIADDLSIKVNSVSVLLRRIRQILFECVSQRMEGATR